MSKCDAVIPRLVSWRLLDGNGWLWGERAGGGMNARFKVVGNCSNVDNR